MPLGIKDAGLEAEELGWAMSGVSNHQNGAELEAEELVSQIIKDEAGLEAEEIGWVYVWCLRSSKMRQGWKLRKLAGPMSGVSDHQGWGRTVGFIDGTWGRERGCGPVS